MSRSGSALAAALAALLVLLAPGDGTRAPPRDSATPPAVLRACTVVDEPGEYVLDADDLRPNKLPSTDCILVRADDVVLDGRGRSFVGHGASDTTGIRVVDASNVTVRGLDLSDWHRAIHFENVDGATIEGVSAEGCVFGVALENSANVEVSGCRIRDNFFGVWTGGSWGLTFSLFGNEIESNTVDIDDTPPPNL